MDLKVVGEQRKAQLLASASEYHKHLDDADEYLRTTRGITAEQAAYYRMGVVVDPLDGDERFKGRLSIPFITPTGIVAIKYRCMEQHDCGELGHPKYDGYSLPVTLYNVRSLSVESPVIIITEGEADAFAVEQQLKIPTVGYPGVSVWQTNRHWARCFSGYKTVYVLADGDDKGRPAAEEIAGQVENGMVINMPDGYDACEFMLANGAEALRAKLNLEQQTPTT